MKQITFTPQDKQGKILKGLNKVADAVSGTIGPKGRNVIIADQFQPKFTNDGHTIAHSLTFKDEWENMGAWLVRNACSKTNDDAGDGTSTTAVLLQEIVNIALTRPENSAEIRTSLEEASQNLVFKLREQSQPITLEEIKKVALISAENEELAELVSSTIQEVGEKGVIVVEESKTFETKKDIQNGYEALAGFMSPYLANNQTATMCVLENVLVLVTQNKISTLSDIAPLFKQMEEAKINKLAIVCEDIDPQILGILVANKMQGHISVNVIKLVGTQLEDVAAVTGATLLSAASGVNFGNLDIAKHLGQAEKISSDSKKTLFIAKSEKGQQLANRLQASLSIITSEYEAEQVRQRIGKLTGGIAVIRVGGKTDADRIYRKHKVDDTVAACKAALAEGVVEGGGMCLWRLAKNLEAKTVGEQILKAALKAPLKKILANAALDYAEIVSGLDETNGYDVRAGQYCSLIENGIIDPTKVERLSLETAISNAAHFISAHAAIVDEPETKK